MGVYNLAKFQQNKYIFGRAIEFYFLFWRQIGLIMPLLADWWRHHRGKTQEIYYLTHFNHSPTRVYNFAKFQQHIDIFRRAIQFYPLFWMQIGFKLCPSRPIGGATRGVKPRKCIIYPLIIILPWYPISLPSFSKINTFFAELFNFTPFSGGTSASICVPDGRLGAPPQG